MRLLLSSLLLISCPALFAQNKTVYETSNGAQTPTYAAAIRWWKDLDALSTGVKMLEMGTTDAGEPLHLVLLSSDANPTVSAAKAGGKVIIFVNNGIHPGEPDGIDASMLLARDIVQKKYKLPANILLAIIPVYNIGGALNRSANFRVDQNGPAEFGFRGNSQNLDLNRDFIKCDSKEARTFTKIFHYLDPDIFVDNHVSNGSDYQHVMTLLETQHNKLGGAMGTFLNKAFTPALYKLMKAKGFDLVPYVNHFGETPDGGWNEFWDSPRYSSGYTALWNVFGFVPETHMLKPYPDRVESTYALMQSFIEFGTANAETIRNLRRSTRDAQRTQDSFPLAWKWNRTAFQEIVFKGYASGHKPSLVSGASRLFYDRSKPFERKVPFYNVYEDTLRVTTPSAYVIPQGWWKVIERLQDNGIPMRRFSRDTVISVERYRIDSYQSSPRPFEGHHVNSNVRVSATIKKMAFRKGDYLIPLNGMNSRFLIETLEPQGEDSYFAWNFFDAILGQKEGFSDYVFEETALELLKKDTALFEGLKERKARDTAFAKNGRAQLNFIYQGSAYMEPAFMQYPVYRVLK